MQLFYIVKTCIFKYGRIGIGAKHYVIDLTGALKLEDKTENVHTVREHSFSQMVNVIEGLISVTINCKGKTETRIYMIYNQ